MENNKLEKKQPTPIARLKNVLESSSVQEQFKNALGEHKDLFIASLIDVVGADNRLQECRPQDVCLEALKAATLKLPINKNLGFAYLVAYDGKPQMQMGYRGYVQLALRSGQYRHIHADKVCEGEIVRKDRISGEIQISGEPKSENLIGAFAYIEFLNGFTKTVYWSKEQIQGHAKRFSQSFKSGKKTPWQTDFDAMCIKTVIKALLSKYGIMSVEMMK